MGFLNCMTLWSKTMTPIKFAGQNFEVTQPLRDLISTKFERLSRHVDNITSIQVVLSVDKLRQIAEAKLHVPGTEIYADAESEDMYKTIDILLSRLLRQIDKHKGKNERHNK